MDGDGVDVNSPHFSAAFQDVISAVDEALANAGRSRSTVVDYGLAHFEDLLVYDPLPSPSGLVAAAHASLRRVASPSLESLAVAVRQLQDVARDAKGHTASLKMAKASCGAAWRGGAGRSCSPSHRFVRHRVCVGGGQGMCLQLAMHWQDIEERQFARVGCTSAPCGPAVRGLMTAPGACSARAALADQLRAAGRAPVASGRAGR